MALTGELSDLSLAELIEFFCNQRKTGRLKVRYPIGAGYFYLKSGAVIHAQFGDLRGIEAVYYALTQPNASFTFTPAVEAPEHSINQPWTSVVLEGLRRMDEGIMPSKPSTNSFAEVHGTVRPHTSKVVVPPAPMVRPETAIKPEKATDRSASSVEDVKAFGVLLSSAENNSFSRHRWAMVVAAVFVLVAIVGVPWGLYSHKKGQRSAGEASAATATAPIPTPTPTPILSESQPEEVTTQGQPAESTEAAEITKPQREVRARERAKNVDVAAKPVANAGSANASTASNKRATVQVSYDENGRVTAASGGDATALRIARQKRFPPGKAGSATITIPIN